jgi:hypothetical protein
MIGPRIDGEAARELLVVPRSRFQQRCLQTSCWLVQLRLQAPLLPDPAGFASVAAVVGMQAFWQIIACVSQLTWHVSVVVFIVGGVMGTGFTVWPAWARSSVANATQVTSTSPPSTMRFIGRPLDVAALRDRHPGMVAQIEPKNHVAGK